MEKMFSRLALLTTPSTTVPLPASFSVTEVLDHVLPNGTEITEEWAEIGTGCAEAPWPVSNPQQ